MEIKRQDYLQILQDSAGKTDLVKVITGMRRTGKTTVMHQHMDNLRSQGIPEESVCYIDLDLLGKETDSEELRNMLNPCLGNKGLHYIFIDEIQDADGWERVVAMLVARGDCDVYITGSNSRMLSSELSTKLSGRYMEVEILPLSFREYMELHGDDPEKRFVQFLRYGSLPSTEPDRGERVCRAQSEGIYSTVMMKDILSRVSGKTGRLNSICRFLYSNIRNVTNAERISEATGLSDDTVRKYLGAIMEAHLFYHADRYDIGGKKVFSSKGKYYATDLGARSILVNPGELRDISAPLENAVFFELLRRGYRVFSGSFRDQEVDFTAIKGDTVRYYQVSVTVMAEETYDREIRPLKSVRDNYEKIILTMDRFGLGNDEGVKVVNVIDWLLDSNAS
ncbi:MAG: ATP-binding protein [Clostridia bacterium]|nr:ATP-binding protein [Clostridia bacterium]